MRKHIFIFLLGCSTTLCASEDSSQVSGGLFEGKVTYIYQILNPNKLLVSDEDFYNDMPNGGRSEATLYIKGNRYRWEYSDRIETYIPKKNQIAILSKRKKDSIYYAYGNIAFEPLTSIKKSELTKQLLGYELSAYEVRTKWDHRTFFYSPNALKTKKSIWRNHKYNYLGDFISKSGSFPMIIHQKSMLGNWKMTVSKIEPMPIQDSVFNLLHRSHGLR